MTLYQQPQDIRNVFTISVLSEISEGIHCARHEVNTTPLLWIQVF